MKKIYISLFISIVVKIAWSQCSTITGPSSVCQYLNVTFSTVAGKPYYNWTVAGNIISGQGTNSIVVQMTSSYPNNVSVYYFNGGSSTCQLYKTVTVNNNSIPTITGPTNICLPDSGPRVQSYSTESNKTSYNWSMTSGIGTITSPTTQNTTVSWNQPGTTILKVYYTQPNGCVSPIKSVNVSVNSKPGTPIISGPSSICFDNNPNTTHTYTPSPNAYSPYEWILYHGSSAVVSSSISHITLDVPLGTTSTYSFGYRYTNPFSGCQSDIGNFYITATNPTPIITGPSNPCTGSGMQYSTESGNSNYAWTITPTSAGVIDTNPSNVSAISTTWSTQGSINVSYIKDGCQSFVGTKNITSIGGGGCSSSRVRSDLSGNGSSVDSDDFILESNAFPIPANKELIVIFSSEVEDGAKVSITSVSGSVIYLQSKNPGESSKVIDTRDFLDGLYILKINSQILPITKKILIKH